MRKHLTAVILGSGAAALALGIGSATVFASTATTWTIKPGGSYTAKSGKTTLTDTKTGAVLTCTSSTAAGKLKSGSMQTSPIGTATKNTFSNCTGPAGLTFSVTTSAFPWEVNATSYSSGTAKGSITGIHAVLKGTNNTCKATVDGTGATKDNGMVKISHSNSAATKLKILGPGDNLHAYNVSTGCLGALNSGDPTTFVTTYTLNKAQTITSP